MRSGNLTYSEQSWFEKAKKKMFRPRTLSIAAGVSAALAVVAFKGYDHLSYLTAVSSAESIISESGRPLGSRINELNGRIYRNPGIFPAIAPKITSEVITDLCAEIGCDPKEELANIDLLSNKEYIDARRENYGCLGDIKIIHGDLGMVLISNNRVIIDRDEVLRSLYGTKQEKLSDKAASGLVTVVIHEGLHRRAELIPISDTRSFRNIQLKPGEQLKYKQGFMLWVVNADMSRPGKECLVVLRADLEEAAIESLTKEKSERLGITGYLSAYDTKVRVFRDRILNRFFSKPSDVQKLHAKSDDEEFFKTIGLGLGAPESEARRAGESYAIVTLRDAR